ncbi:unnamed protein product, partial [Rotaria socialis]
MHSSFIKEIKLEHMKALITYDHT